MITSSLKTKLLGSLGTALILTACQATTVDVRPVYDKNLVLNTGPADAAAAQSDYYKQGKAYLATSDYGLAIKAFRESLSWDGPNSPALNGLGIAYDMLGRFDLAERYYREALMLEPGSATTYRNIALSQRRQGSHEKAEEYSQIAEALLTGRAERPVSQVAQNMPPAYAPDFGPADPYRVERTGSRGWAIVATPPRKPPVPQPVKPLATPSISAAPYQQLISFNVRSILKPPAPSDKPEMAEARTESDDALAGTDQKTSTPRTTYRILNGAGRTAMAARMRTYLNHNGLSVWGLANAAHFNFERSVIHYAPGHKDEAEALAAQLPIAATLTESQDVKAYVELTLGHDLLAFDHSLTTDASTPSTPNALEQDRYDI